jgi:hypothetical protein
VIGSVVAALAAKFTALVGTGVPVYVGPPVTAAADLELVVVGDDGDPDSDAQATVERVPDNLAGSSTSEIGVIPCVVIVQSGDTDMQARLSRATVLVQAIAAGMATDISLGGAVLSAYLSGGACRPVQNESGAAAVASFTVTYHAQI